MDDNKKVDPKQYVMQTFKSGNGERIKKVLLRYYAYVNFYKRQKLEKSEDIVDKAIEIFGT